MKFSRLLQSSSSDTLYGPVKKLMDACQSIESELSEDELDSWYDKLIQRMGSDFSTFEGLYDRLGSDDVMQAVDYAVGNYNYSPDEWERGLLQGQWLEIVNDAADAYR